MSATEMKEEWFTLMTDEVAAKLETSLKGLVSDEVKKRIAKYGYNELVAGKKRGPLDIFVDQFKDIFVIILIFASIVSTYVSYLENEPFTETVAIVIIIALIAVVGFIQEYRSEKTIEAMMQLTAPKAKVVRDGREETVAGRDVVPGDMILLDAGDRVPADARLTESVDLATNEAPLTGESTAVNKITDRLEAGLGVGDRKNMVFMGTYTTFGRGKAIVTGTGMNTEFGKIAKLVQSAKAEPTPLEEKLDSFAKRIAGVTLVLCAVIFILEGFQVHWQFGELLDAFVASISLAVSVVPEGLPAIVTVTLALTARDLAKKNAVIRKLSSAETLGSVTYICSDKTGTLTKGEMTVTKLYTGGKIYDVSGVGYEPVGTISCKGEVCELPDNRELEPLLRIGLLCSNSKLVLDDNKRWTIRGDPTEAALMAAAGKAGMGYDELLDAHPKLHEIPFSSERMRMTTCHLEYGEDPVAYVKGAPETILNRCRNVLIDGKLAPMTEAMRKDALAANEQFASEALRVLGMAYKKLPKGIDAFDADVIETDLTFVGLEGMIDPPREEAIRANATCREAGIQTVMITGDHRLTAVAVAKQLGMMKEDSIVLTGAELDAISDEKFEEIAEKVIVYARVSPEHKMRIVRALKAKGQIVAMTGDGVNDAPAIKNADIGVAMGITGTDVTKEASHMVLADDNFATIVTAVHGGRVAFDNIRKYARFLLACNFDEVLVVGTMALLNFPVPMTAPMLLWINLATDGGPAMALSFEPADPATMKRKPRNPEAGILSGMVSFIFASFLLQAGGSLIVFLGELWPALSEAGYQVGMDVTSLLVSKFGEKAAEHLILEARTAVFIQATLFELFVVWNCRSDTRGLFRGGVRGNKWIIISSAVALSATTLLCYVPFLAEAFGVIPLTAIDWIWTGGVASWGLFCSPEIFYGRRILKWE